MVLQYLTGYTIITDAFMVYKNGASISHIEKMWSSHPRVSEVTSLYTKRLIHQKHIRGNMTGFQDLTGLKHQFHA